MGNAVEVPAQVCVHYLPMSARQQLVDMPYGIQRAAVGTIGVLLGRQVGLEDGSENQRPGLPHVDCRMPFTGQKRR